MYPLYLFLLSSFSCITLTAGELNLLTFATGGSGQVLGSTFGLPGANATFDYVVVGGGTAGLAIATRLALDPSLSVEVVEAGGFYEIGNGNRSIVPTYATYFTGSNPDGYQPLIDWGFVTEPQEVRTCPRVTTAGPYGIPALNYTLSARKEVIVSAGTFQSPQLLMVSGIGSQDQLRQNNIEVKKDLPGVGQNMWDHVLSGVSRRVNVQTASASANSPVLAARLAEQFRTNGSGPLAAFGAGFYGWEDLP
ncbi:MAG: hypothetical protein Q9180_006978 [Flavoplaca navasiana]